MIAFWFEWHRFKIFGSIFEELQRVICRSLDLLLLLSCLFLFASNQLRISLQVFHIDRWRLHPPRRRHRHVSLRTHSSRGMPHSDDASVR